MTTPFKGDYAFGLFVSTLNGRKAISHGGTLQGFSTSLVYYPEDKLTVAVLGNLNWPAPDEIASKLGALAHGEKVELPSGERKEITLSRDVLSRYTGTYDFEPGANLLIKLEGDQLSAKLGGQPWTPIYPESETMFFLKAADAQLEFRKDTKGAVTGVVMHQGGRHHDAPRKSSTIELPPGRKAIVVLPGRPVTDETSPVAGGKE
jgi:Domain of unknown function (DUF3471)